MASSGLFVDFLITIVPISLIGASFYLLARFRRRGLSKAVRAGYGGTIALLTVWGMYQLWVVARGDGLSGLIMLNWVIFGIPVAMTSFVLIWSVVTLTQAGPSRTGKHFAFGFIIVAAIAAAGFVYKDTQLGIAGNPNTEPERLRALYHGWYAGVEPKVLQKLAYNPNTPIDILQHLAKHDELRVRENVCRNQATPTSLLSEMAKSRDWQIRWCVAERPNVSDEILAQLSDDPSDSVRRGLAYNTASPELLLKLSQDNSKEVRTTVALNKYTPVEALVGLAKDHHENVRRLVAARTDLPLEQQLQLADDQSAIVRDALLHGGKTPIEVLEKLANDPVEKVRQSVERRMLERTVTERNR